MKKLALALVLVLMVVSMPLGNVSAQSEDNIIYKSGRWVAVIDPNAEGTFVIGTVMVDNDTPTQMLFGVIYDNGIYYYYIMNIEGFPYMYLVNMARAEIYEQGNPYSYISLYVSYDPGEDALFLNSKNSNTDILKLLITTRSIKLKVSDYRGYPYLFDINTVGFRECHDYALDIINQQGW
jgi:hypothetical protein